MLSIFHALHARRGLPCLALALILAAGHESFGQDRRADPSEPAAAPETPQAHLGAGYQDLRNSRYEAAAREFRAALALDPKLAMQARFPLAVCFFEMHQAPEARREFEAVQRDAGDHPNIDYYLGRLDLAEGKLESATLELNKAAANPPFPDTAAYLGLAYLKNRKLALAEKWLLKAAGITPNDAVVQYQLGQLYSQSGRKREAQQAFARSEQLRRHRADVDRLRTECSKKLGQSSVSDARLVCDQLFDPGDIEKLTILGTLYGNHGDFEEALKPLQRAAEISPNSPQTQYNLAFDLFQLKRFQEARESIAKAVSLWPDLFPLNALLGAVLYNLGEKLPSYQVLHHAHELDPQDQETSVYLYEVALDLAEQSKAGKQYREALGYLSEAANLRPQEPEPHRLRAEVYESTGRSAEAAEQRRKAQRLSPATSAKPD